ncbi:reverse transcriptase domain-containing protein [Tanacetum coccineum]
METVFRISNCTVENQVKFATCTLMGIALTWWNSHARTVTNDVAYAMTWTDLKKKMTTKYCPRNEIKKIEAELWNLKVKGTDVVAYNQRIPNGKIAVRQDFPEETDNIESMSEAIEMATELMDRRINTFAERQAENKRKFEDTPRNNQNQQPNKRQNTGRAYAAGNGDKKPYEGTKPLCPKRHNGMDWLDEITKQLFIDCAKESFVIHFGSEILISHGRLSRNKPGLRLNIISCTKTQKYLLQGMSRLFGTYYHQGDGRQVKEEAMQDVPIVKIFPRSIYPEDFARVPFHNPDKWNFTSDLVPWCSSTV